MTLKESFKGFKGPTISKEQAAKLQEVMTDHEPPVPMILNRPVGEYVEALDDYYSKHPSEVRRF
ncbi:hypothetical protein C0584_00180 [Candidatus Parcubacteria bacterium]|nr:MAG: hypothetical protein C0584_00180 [Candidatus Parcubacteria bacterium]